MSFGRSFEKAFVSSAKTASEQAAANLREKRRDEKARKEARDALIARYGADAVSRAIVAEGPKQQQTEQPLPPLTAAADEGGVPVQGADLSNVIENMSLGQIQGLASSLARQERLSDIASAEERAIAREEGRRQADRKEADRLAEIERKQAYDRLAETYPQLLRQEEMKGATLVEAPRVRTEPTLNIPPLPTGGADSLGEGVEGPMNLNQSLARDAIEGSPYTPEVVKADLSSSSAGSIEGMRERFEDERQEEALRQRALESRMESARSSLSRKLDQIRGSALEAGVPLPSLTPQQQQKISLLNSFKPLSEPDFQSVRSIVEERGETLARLEPEVNKSINIGMLEAFDGEKTQDQVAEEIRNTYGEAAATKFTNAYTRQVSMNEGQQSRAVSFQWGEVVDDPNIKERSKQTNKGGDPIWVVEPVAKDDEDRIVYRARFMPRILRKGVEITPEIMKAAKAAQDKANKENAPEGEEVGNLNGAVIRKILTPPTPISPRN